MSKQPLPSKQLSQKFQESELVIGVVGAVGTEIKKVVDILKEHLHILNYEQTEIHISQDVIPNIVELVSGPPRDEYKRISALMDAGNEARNLSQDNAVLALGAAAKISASRPSNEPRFKSRHAYIINSLKHPDEVVKLREIYTEGFFLIGAYSSQEKRLEYLIEDKRISKKNAQALITRDEDEHLPYGQRTSDTFHLSDFFVHVDGNQHNRLKDSLKRILDTIFGHFYKTPTFDEFAMFMAFSSSLRSADLSRQVGAVVTKENEILATGANDCPRYGGGLYWPNLNSDGEIVNHLRGRDCERGEDSNKAEQEKIITNILKELQSAGVKADDEILRQAIKKSRIRDITEYGRVVHAEMEALLSCARNNINCRGATLYCTTFPCHNCAKHIIAAGIERVVYIEPYPKSKALEFHDDAIIFGFTQNEDKVKFEPFVGVGPRRFFDLFSMNFGSGYPLVRKKKDGSILDWDPEKATLRIQMLPSTYLDREDMASSIFNTYRKEIVDAAKQQ